jgi:hypothetical protein
MERLSFLATFVSLIYGLGVANVLGHLAGLIKRGRDADWFWVHSLWALCLLVMMAGFWWVLQNWGRESSIGFFNYLSLLLTPSLLYVVSDVLFPDRNATGPVDLKAHFFSVRRPFFLLYAGLLFVDELDTVQKGWSHVLALGPVYLSAQVIGYLTAVVGYRSTRVWVQGILVLVTLVFFTTSIANALSAV